MKETNKDIYIPQIGDKVKLLNDIFDHKYSLDPSDDFLKGTFIPVLKGSKGDSDVVANTLFDPLSRSYIITLKNTKAMFIWDTDIELIKENEQ